MSDLFDLLDTRPEGLKNRWDKIVDAHCIAPTLADHYLDLLLKDDPQPPTLGFAMSRGRTIAIDRTGIWIDRPHGTDKPDLTWTQTKTELEAKARALHPDSWTKLLQLHDTYVKATEARNEADLINLHSRPEREQLVANLVRATKAQTAAWLARRDYFTDIFNLNPEGLLL